MSESGEHAARMTEARLDFETVLMPLLDAAFGLALHLTRNRSDAEDLVQDAVLRALRAYDSFQPGTNFKAWFFRILTNRFHDQYRKRRAQRTDLSLEDASDLYLLVRSNQAGLDMKGDDPWLAALRHIETEQIIAALQDLPEEYRVTAALYFVENFSYQEMADMLEIPIGTIRSRLHRARRMLQKRLWQMAEDGGLIAGPLIMQTGGAA
jgi:RNA polymerase sigma-70 factor, ECF subfamily